MVQIILAFVSLVCIIVVVSNRGILKALLHKFNQESLSEELDIKSEVSKIENVNKTKLEELNND